MSGAVFFLSFSACGSKQSNEQWEKHMVNQTINTKRSYKYWHIPNETAKKRHQPPIDVLWIAQCDFYAAVITYYYWIQLNWIRRRPSRAPINMLSDFIKLFHYEKAKKKNENDCPLHNHHTLYFCAYASTIDRFAPVKWCVCPAHKLKKKKKQPKMGESKFEYTLTHTASTNEWVENRQRKRERERKTRPTNWNILKHIDLKLNTHAPRAIRYRVFYRDIGSLTYSFTNCPYVWFGC